MGSKHSAAATPARRAPARQPVRSKGKPVRRRVKPDDDDGGARLPPEERQQLIAFGAYYRAEVRGFAPGRELQDWLDAESEIDGVFPGRNTSPDMV